MTEHIDKLIDISGSPATSAMGKPVEDLQTRIRQLEQMQHISAGTIEELRHHAADIQQVVAWLHQHAPERFDARLSMGTLITGILNEWLVGRRPRWRRAVDTLFRRKGSNDNEEKSKP